jgi:cysteine desulfurase
MQVAALLNAPADAVVFTSGGTEANNLAVLGVAQRYDRPQHIIISSVEHAAVSEPARWLAQRGWQVTQLPVDSCGRISPLDLQMALRPDTVLVSVIYGQSEVGTIQPIAALADIIQQWRTHQGSDLVFHTDAVQVAGRLPLDVQQLPVDLVSISSHKLYGPQGAGALYIRPGVTLTPLLGGGGQEFRLRSGTQAVPTLAGFGIAAELAAQELPDQLLRLQRLRDRLFEQLADHPLLMPTGDRIHRLPHHVSFCLRPHAFPWDPTITGKTIVRQMNLAGIAISSGSACNSGKTIASPTLLAMGWDDHTARTGIRLTLGRSTSEADIDWTALVLRQILVRLQPQLSLA